LLQESLNYPKKWGVLAKLFVGRTQHNVKNRFISVMSKALKMNIMKIRNLMHDDIRGYTKKALEELQIEKVREFSESSIKQEYIMEKSFQIQTDLA
jgi:hypothetical protein